MRLCTELIIFTLSTTIYSKKSPTSLWGRPCSYDELELPEENSNISLGTLRGKYRQVDGASPNSITEFGDIFFTVQQKNAQNANAVNYGQPTVWGTWSGYNDDDGNWVGIFKAPENWGGWHMRTLRPDKVKKFIVNKIVCTDLPEKYWKHINLRLRRVKTDGSASRNRWDHYKK